MSKVSILLTPQEGSHYDEAELTVVIEGVGGFEATYDMCMGVELIYHNEEESQWVADLINADLTVKKGCNPLFGCEGDNDFAIKLGKAVADGMEDILNGIRGKSSSTCIKIKGFSFNYESFKAKLDIKIKHYQEMEAKLNIAKMEAKKNKEKEKRKEAKIKKLQAGLLTL